ncbi:methyl-accepting chemotaxis protein [Paenibacillus crassostreae]|uniref:Chemotaxis protein n=1 Tax=Paenibacillus crassostreae TaxID=1763538 RepID=A0A167B7A8_9BACL|nr:methyl-accepting chemotaxis protein [Paenibacillus crassostreae]AOZ93112.1 methyl-accepting chemotaxis protein [Paenibacillus crassostreae]OAB71799.1 chemotaxis protein [Paenibacillus crassostreae]
MGLAKRVTLTLITLLIIVGASISIFAYQITYRQVDEALGIETVGCANITSGLVDPEDIIALAQGDATLLSEVESNIDWIVHKKDLFKEAYILSLEGKILAVDTNLKSRGYKAGDAFYFDEDAREMILSMKHSAYSEVYTYDDVQLKTGYGPIYKNNDPNQEIVGLLAINVDAPLIQQRTIDTLKYPFIVGTILFIAAALIIHLIIRRMINPLAHLSANVHRIAKGDLTLKPLKINSKDEIGKLATDINIMTSNLQSLIREVNDTSMQVASSSQELSASSKQSGEAGQHTTIIIEQMASGAEKQLQNLEVGSQQIAEISNFIAEISISTEQALHSASDNLHKAQIGRIAMNDTVAQMLLMNKDIQELSQTIQSLQDHSQDIRNMLHVMTRMAEETSLLALNAAIEAARAGEEGRGFAVVASSVKKLSENSAQSAKEISAVVNTTMHLMENISDSMLNTVTQVTERTKQISEVGSSFEQIEFAATHISAQNEYVATAVHQLSESANILVDTAKVLVEVANQTSDGAQTVSAASQQQLSSLEEIDSSASILSGMSEKLHSLIERFKV